jgi:two-component system, cell cycle response regulator
MKNDEPAPRPYSECLFVVEARDTTLLGTRYPLYGDLARIGRGSENDISIPDEKVSRQHAHLERRDGAWWVVNASSNGTHCNGELLSSERALENGDRIKMGKTTVKLLGGADLEEQCREELHRLDIHDNQTKFYKGRAFNDALESAIDYVRKSNEGLAIMLLEIDDLAAIDDSRRQAVDNFLVEDLARFLQENHKSDDLSVRLVGREFGVVLRERSLEAVAASVAQLRRKVAEHQFVFQSEPVQVSIRVGSALFSEEDSADDLLKRAVQALGPPRRR